MTKELPIHEEIRNAVINKINHLQQALEELQNSLPPFGPHKFAEAVEVILTAIRNFFYSNIQSIKKANTGTEESAKEIINQSKICLALLREVHRELLCYLKKIDSFSIPSELLFSIKNLLTVSVLAIFIFTNPFFSAAKSEQIVFSYRDKNKEKTVLMNL